MKIKRICMALCLVLFFSGCASNTSGNQGQKSGISSNGIDYEKGNQLLLKMIEMGEDAGYYVGDVDEYVPQNKLEENMLSQTRSYLSAIFMGDGDSMFAYLYPGAIDYCIKYGGMTRTQVKHQFCDSLCDDTAIALEQYHSIGIDVIIKCTDITTKVESDSDMLYVFDQQGVIRSQNHTVHMDPEGTVAISHNGGKTWTFLGMNDSTPNYLRGEFSEDIISKVMDY